MNIKQQKLIKKNNEALIESSTKLMGTSSVITSSKVESFLDHVKSKKRISINVNAESLLQILDSGMYMNVFQLGYGEKEIRARYDSYEKAYFEKLKGFIANINKGKSIKYGALNTGAWA